VSGGVEFRASDEFGRPLDPAALKAETPTQRAERIDRLQVARLAQGPAGIPPSDPQSVFSEWCRSPENMQSRFAQLVAEDSSLLPAAELEPGPGQQPRPGGLIARMTRDYHLKYAMIRDNLPAGG
jgi:hypothetical protein